MISAVFIILMAIMVVISGMDIVFFTKNNEILVMDVKILFVRNIKE